MGRSDEDDPDLLSLEVVLDHGGDEVVGLLLVVQHGLEGHEQDPLGNVELGLVLVLHPNLGAGVEVL